MTIRNLSAAALALAFSAAPALAGASAPRACPDCPNATGFAAALSVGLGFTGLVALLVIVCALGAGRFSRSG